MSSVNGPVHVGGVPIRDLAELVGLPDPRSGVPATGVTLDSREVTPGDLYAALPGANVHGASFASGVVHSGAVAVLTDPAGARIIRRDGQVTVPLLVVPDPRAVLGELSAAVYGCPARSIEMVGVTGTNGKTTVAYLVESAWRALGRTTGLIGTIETRVAGQSRRSGHTTPEAPSLQRLLAHMREREVAWCVMEVSSHALALHRVDAVQFGTAVFTNLSQDHLDFHGTMENYYEAKALLFTPERSRSGVVCVDDHWGRRLARAATVPVVTLATPVSDAGDGDEQPDWRLVPEGDVGEFRLVREAAAQGPDTLRLRSALPGDHNRVNTALAALTLLGEGVPAHEVVRALGAPARVPGRMEIVELDQQPERPEQHANPEVSISGSGSTSTSGIDISVGGSGDRPAGRSEEQGAAEVPFVVVDFAHTPDAIDATLGSLRAVADRRRGPLVAVFGAGGDRDPGKRPRMGEAAARWADVVVVTDDNPRREEPALIRTAVAEGVHRQLREHPERHVRVLEVEGRAAGIAAGLAEASDGGVLAVLGKGHETSQTIGTTVHPFDDREAVLAAWRERPGAASNTARSGHEGDVHEGNVQEGENA